MLGKEKLTKGCKPVTTSQMPNNNIPRFFFRRMNFTFVREQLIRLPLMYTRIPRFVKKAHRTTLPLRIPPGSRCKPLRPALRALPPSPGFLWGKVRGQSPLKPQACKRSPLCQGNPPFANLTFSPPCRKQVRGAAAPCFQMIKI
jgi:hypothetical protein